MPVVLLSRDADLIERCRRAVSAEHQFEVAPTMSGLTQLVALLKPLAVLLDASMLDRPFERQVAAVVSSCARGCVVVMTPSFEEDTEIAFLKVGAKGCCRRGIDAESLRQVLTVTGSGGVWVTPNLIPRLVKELQRYAEGHRARVEKVKLNHTADLTPREQEVVQLTVEGASNKEVAAALEIEERTVKGHMTNILRKFGISNRLKLVVQIKELGPRA